MKSTILILCSMFATQVAWAADGGVKRVVVLADRAELTRTASADCKDGKARVDLPPLSSAIDPRTLRAEVEGRGKLLGLSSRVEQTEEAVDARTAVLEAKIEALRDAMRVKQDESQRYSANAAAAASFSGYLRTAIAEGLRNPAAKTSEWQASIAFVKQEQLAAQQKVVEVGVELRELTRQLEVLGREYSVAKSAGDSEQARLVTVAVECGGAPRATVHVSYVLPGATWRPEYDLRFFPRGDQKIGDGKIELTLAAVVQQSTGEDWEDVTLVLSTAKPRLGSEAPYPARLYVDAHESDEAKVMVQGRERREVLKAGGASQDQGPSGAALEDGGRTFSFELPRKVTVKADGRPYWMPVDRIEGKGTAKLVTVPKMSPYVFQVLALNNPAPYPLLAGRLHTYRRGSYVGDGSTKYVAPGEPMEVSLGLDEEVRVERIDLKEHDKDPGFLSRTKRLERAYRTKLTSRARGVATVEVRENIPVSKQEEIVVELNTKQTSPGYALDAERGFVTWSLKVKESAEVAVDLAYTVKLPDDWKIQ